MKYTRVDEQFAKVQSQYDSGWNRWHLFRIAFRPLALNLWYFMRRIFQLSIYPASAVIL